MFSVVLTSFWPILCLRDNGTLFCDIKLCLFLFFFVIVVVAALNGFNSTFRDIKLYALNGLVSSSCCALAIFWLLRLVKQSGASALNEKKDDEVRSALFGFGLLCYRSICCHPVFICAFVSHFLGHTSMESLRFYAI